MGGGGVGPVDTQLKQKLDEMEAEQRNAWEEKERLSRCANCTNHEYINNISAA